MGLLRQLCTEPSGRPLTGLLLELAEVVAGLGEDGELDVTVLLGDLFQGGEGAEEVVVSLDDEGGAGHGGESGFILGAGFVDRGYGMAEEHEGSGGGP